RGLRQRGRRGQRHRRAAAPRLHPRAGRRDLGRQLPARAARRRGCRTGLTASSPLTGRGAAPLPGATAHPHGCPPMSKLPRASALALSITALLFLPPAHAETTIEPDASGSGVATTLDRLTVTGARATGRTIENSPAPIDVISAQELESTT